MRRKLTDEEYNAIANYTSSTHLDSVFDVTELSSEEDGFADFENDCTVGLQEGLEWLYDSVAYPLVHDVDMEDALLIASLFKEFNVADEDDINSLLKEDE